MSYERLTTGLGYVATYGPAVWYGVYHVGGALFGPSYIKCQSRQGTRMQSVLPELFERVEGLRTDIENYIWQGGDTLKAIGTNFGPGAVIFVPQEFANNQVLAHGVRLLLKHELSHINTSDHFKASALAALSALILAIALPKIIASFPSWAKPAVYTLPWCVSQFVHLLTSFHFECQADTFACDHATDQELLDGYEIFKAQRDIMIELHSRFPLQFTAEGNINPVLDPTHPPITDRLEFFGLEIGRRNLQPYTGSTSVYEEAKAIFRTWFGRQLNVSLNPDPAGT